MRRFEIQPVRRDRLGVRGSEWTAVSGSLLPAVALLLGARQRRLGLGLKGSGKVGPRVPRVRALCYSPVLLRLGPDRGGLQRMPLLARVPSVRPVVDRGGLLAVLRDCCRSFGR